MFTDVRVREHQGFNRIVLEFSGTGTPGWTVNCVNEAALEGSGDVVTLGGDSTLQIVASNTTWPASDYYNGPTQLRAETGRITEVYVVGTVEGYTQVFTGIDGPRAPFRVIALTRPSRLVIDVVDDSGTANTHRPRGRGPKPRRPRSVPRRRCSRPPTASISSGSPPLSPI